MSTNQAYFKERLVLPSHSQQGRQRVTAGFARGRDITPPAGKAALSYKEAH